MKLLIIQKYNVLKDDVKAKEYIPIQKNYKDIVFTNATKCVKYNFVGEKTNILHLKFFDSAVMFFQKSSFLLLYHLLAVNYLVLE